MSDTPVRVVHCLDSLEITGGVQTMIMNVYRNIDKSRVQFDFAAYDVPEQNSYVHEIESSGGRVFKVDNLSTAKPLRFYMQYKRLFGNERFCAVHAHNIQHNGIILMAAKHCGISNRISHSHQCFDDRANGFAKKIFNSILMKMNLHYATERVACSDVAAKFLYGDNSYIFLPNAVEYQRFMYYDVEKSTVLRSELGIRKGENVLMHIGRFAPQKNHFFFIDVLKNLPENFKYKMLFVGDGELREEFSRAIADNGLDDRCMLLGVRSDVPELLAITDLFLLPSTSEGLPVCIIEAQESGVMSIISDTITHQTDLNLGLVEFLPITDGKRWSERIVESCNRKHSATHEQRLEAIKTHGFDMNSCTEEFYRLYKI